MSNDHHHRAPVVRETMTRLRRQTVRDFEALPEGTLAQLIEGEIIMSPSPSVRHQTILFEMARRLADHVDRHGGVVILSPMDVHLSENSVLQPDILYISDERRGIIQEQVHGAPDLVVEVLSPSTGYYDLTRKREIYLVEGVRECWLIDPERETVEVQVAREDDFETAGQLQHSGTAESSILPGFEIDLKELFATG